jgi:diguanylate cyclase (GGDEF)-like protein
MNKTASANPLASGPLLPRTTMECVRVSLPTAREELALHVMRGPRKGDVLVIPEHAALLGRGEDAHFCIEDPTLSRHHVRFERRGKLVQVEDLGSLNGTYVGEQRLGREKHDLTGGEILTMGNLQLRFASEDPEAIAASRALYEAAVRDGLTGLHNRAYFDDRLQAEYHWAMRSRHPLTLLIMDLDHFKSVNDTFGHPAGDAVLRTAAHSIVTSIRAEDLAARFGGEEFVVLAKGADRHGAQLLAQRLRTRIAASRVPELSHFSLTASLGVAVCDGSRSYASARALLQAADEALYIAKRSGRDRVVLHHPGNTTTCSAVTSPGSLRRT